MSMAFPCSPHARQGAPAFIGEMPQYNRDDEASGLLAGRDGRPRMPPRRPLNKSRDGAGRVFARSGLLDDGDQRAADDGGVGEFAHRGKVLRVRDAEADRDGQIRISAQALDELFGVGGKETAVCR